MSAELVVTRPALRYHGAKFRIAQWVISHFPPHRCYVESFGGGAGVLLQKPRSFAEIYNDLDGEIVNYFRVLRDPLQRAALEQAIALTPYARDEFERAWDPTTDPVERARRTAIRAQMGFGSNGASAATTGFRVDTKRHHAGSSVPNQRTWSTFPESIRAAGERFVGVLIENVDAVECMLQHDAADALHYVDPPYMHITRDRRNRTSYRHELTDADHMHLIAALQNMRGMVIVSGYLTNLYGGELSHWERRTTTARISTGVSGAATRTECIWLNAACGAALAEVEAARQETL